MIQRDTDQHDASHRDFEWVNGDDFADLPCDKRVQWALLNYPHGRRLPRAALRGCFGGSLVRRPAGSENWPPMAFMYSVLTAQEEADELLPYFRGEGDWSLGGSEGQSLIYGVWPWVAALLLYPELGGEVREACRRWLRAVVARLALSAKPAVPEVVKARFGSDAPIRLRRSGDGGDLPALFVHAPGERSATLDGWWVRHSHLHAFLASALGIRWRVRTPPPRFPYPEPPSSAWPLHLLNWLLRSRMGSGSPAVAWGLDHGERRILRRFVMAPDPPSAAPLLEWLRPYPNLSGLVSTWLYFESGAVVAVASHSTNHVKRGQGSILLAASRGDGRLAWRESAVEPWASRQPTFAEISGDAVHLFARRGPRRVFPLRRFGRLYFTVEHRADGFHLREA